MKNYKNKSLKLKMKGRYFSKERNGITFFMAVEQYIWIFFYWMWYSTEYNYPGKVALKSQTTLLYYQCYYSRIFFLSWSSLLIESLWKLNILYLANTIQYKKFMFLTQPLRKQKKNLVYNVTVIHIFLFCSHFHVMIIF